VCNRHEFHDLATLSTQVMVERIPPIIYTHPVFQSGLGHRWQYGACALRSGYLRLPTHTHNM
jgi:hypothetical protein